MDDLQDIEDDGAQVDDRRHEHLLNAVAKLDGKRAKLKQRREARSDASEYGLGTTTKKAKVVDLVRNLNNRQADREIKKKIKKYSKSKTKLPAPLPRVKESRIKREVAYKKVQKDLGAWKNIIEKNRLAEQTYFPLQQADLRLVTAEEFGSKFKPKTPLELEVSRILEESPHNLKEELTEFEKEAIAAMSLEKAKEVKAMLCKTRALESYKAAKARRQNRIKSKKYHKILKRERIKQHLAEFEALKKQDPAAAMKKLEELEEIRMQERMSLKHRSTGKWAKSRAIRAKYDKESREAIADQLRLNRELKQKWNHLAPKGDESSSSDDDNSEDETQEDKNEELAFKDSMENLKKLAQANRKKDMEEAEESRVQTSDQEPCKIPSRNEENTDTDASENQDASEKQDTNVSLGDPNINDVAKQPSNDEADPAEKSKKTKKPPRKPHRRKTSKGKWFVLDKEGDKKRTGSSVEDWKSTCEDGLDEGLERKTQMEDFQITDKDRRSRSLAVKEKPQIKKQTKGKGTREENDQEASEIDPTKFVAKVALKSRIHNFVSQGNEGMDDSDEDDDEDNRKKHLIAEAFADDNVIEDFRKEKEEEIKESTLQDENTCLPGWGDWGGKGMEEQHQRKKRFFTLKAPPRPPRKDDRIGNVILSEHRDEKLRRHQVSQLPYHFTTVADFESSIRQPIGKKWMPETAHMQLTRPKVMTRIGTIIAPMDKQDVFKKKVDTIK